MPYFYEHANGSIIEKPTIVVNAAGGPREYFSGPFVRRWWFENPLLRPVLGDPPPDTSDIPETHEEWFRKATWRGLSRDRDGGPDPLKHLEPKL